MGVKLGLGSTDYLSLYQPDSNSKVVWSDDWPLKYGRSPVAAFNKSSAKKVTTFADHAMSDSEVPRIRYRRRTIRLIENHIVAFEKGTAKIPHLRVIVCGVSQPSCAGLNFFISIQLLRT